MIGKYLLGLWWMLGLNIAAMAAQPINTSISCGDADIPVTRYPANGRALVIWLPSEFGMLAQDDAIAQKLAAQGNEIWLADVYGGRFLPVVASSAEEIPASDIYQLLRSAARTKKRLYLLTSARGAKYALEGARLWEQHEGKKQPIAGAILLYPNLYAKQPDPGEDPTYLPIASDTRLRIDILQGDLSPWYWTLDSLQAAFATRGSTVRVQVLPGVRDRFYFRDSANATERAMGERLPDLIAATLKPVASRSKK